MKTSQRYAAIGLTDMGKDAKEAADALHKLLGNSTGNVKLGAAAALLKIEQKPAEIIPIVIAELENDDPEVRVNAADILLHIGPAAKESVGKLRLLMNRDPHEGVREAAKIALRHIENPEP